MYFVIVRLFNNSNNSRMVISKCNSKLSQQCLQVRTRMGWQARPGQWCPPNRILTGCLVIQAMDLGLVFTLPH